MTTAAESRPRKPKKCRTCAEPFQPRSMTHVCCSIKCSVEFARTKREKVERKQLREAAAVERASIKERTEKLKNRGDYTKDAQKAFNAFIRKRDENDPCICCGQFGADEAWKLGGSWDAGHFLGVGAYPELRFLEENCHKQLKSCNAGSGKYARKGRTVAQEYRERLIAKIGIERVESLEGPHEPKHYSIEDLKAIKAEYIRKRKELEAAK